MQVIKQLDHYWVVLLDQSEKIDPAENYGVYNTEFSTIDMRVSSEQAARALAEQHNYAKKSAITTQAELEPEIKSSTVIPLSKRAQ